MPTVKLNLSMRSKSVNFSELTLGFNLSAAVFDPLAIYTSDTLSNPIPSGSISGREVGNYKSEGIGLGLTKKCLDYQW